MTQYKVGDEVLVRAKITNTSQDKDGREFYDLIVPDDFCSETLALYPKDIYSLAPEYNIGEKVIVSDTNSIDYSNVGEFVGMDVDGCYVVDGAMGLQNWKFAYKIKLEQSSPDNFIMLNGKK